MTPFLKTAAERIIAEQGYDLENTIIVFPNQRPIIFLKEHFKTLINRTIFMPKITCIDDWVAELSGLDMVDNVFLLFELFRIHCHTGNTKYTTFSEFIPFAEMLVRDFSEIDANLVDAQSLFDNIKDDKRLGEWDVSGSELTQLQKEYLRFFESLYSYYSMLRERLGSLGKAYNGMAYRKVAENIEDYIPNLKNKTIYFVGFNALNKCDEKIIRTLNAQGIATLITDGDDYYYANKDQEAGHFLRLLREKGIKGLEESYGTWFGKEKKKITVVSCPENILQAKTAGHILSNMGSNCNNNEERFHSTAVVLADETLLIPMLNSLPHGTVTNVTMGFPYIYSGIHSFAIDLFELHINAKNNTFFHKNVSNVISNIFIQRALNNTNTITKLNKEIQKSKNTYINIADILPADNSDIDIIRFLFAPENIQPKVFLQMCQKVVTLIDESGIFGKNATDKDRTTFAKEQAALSFFSKIIAHFDELLENFDFVSDLDTLKKIYSKIAMAYRISFKGEPLKNLQILGMLETRSLDFDNIIILSANEGRMPEGRNTKSIIPISMKRAFGMPTYSDNDAIYAYHFYRLIQRCKNLYIIYSTDSNGIGKGEMSRFVAQLEKELCPQYKIKIDKETAIYKSTDITNGNNAEQKHDNTTNSVAKTPMIMDRIMAIAHNKDKGFSPSALNIYHKCPLRYFREKVLNITEQKELTDDIDSSELGSMIHHVLEICFKRKQYINGIVDANILKLHKNNVDSYLDTYIQNTFGNNFATQGNGYLFREIAKKQIINFLTFQIEEIERGVNIEIVATEENMSPQIEFDGQYAYIKGVIDRVDIIDGALLRIADYKSGSVEPRELKGNTQETNAEKIQDKWFQAMTYSWTYWKEGKLKDHPNVCAGMYPLRKHIGENKRDDNVFMKIETNRTTAITNDVMTNFQTLLQTTIGEILNKNIPFHATTNKENCKYCPFNMFCQTPLKQ